MKAGEVFGKYLPLDRIASGGMAQVFRALDTELGDLVAIKILHPDLARHPYFLSTLLDEMVLSRRLVHPGLCRVLDVGSDQDTHYLVTEYVPGRSLRQIIDHQRALGAPLPPPMACGIMLAACDALDFAHRAREERGRALELVHRDVTPENCLVSYLGEVKLIDFGVAKYRCTAREETGGGVIKGTVGYMSPEQAAGKTLDRRSDVFSAGVVLFELLTNQRLFEGEALKVLSKTRDGSVIPPSLLNEAVPEELDEVVIKALALNPDDRFQWASQLSEALGRFLQHQGATCETAALERYMTETFAADLRDQQEFVAHLGEAGGRLARLLVEEQPKPRLEDDAPISWWEAAALAAERPEPPREVTERRSRPRIRQSVKVALKWRKMPAPRAEVREALLLDISEGGVQVRSPELLPANARVELDLRLSPESLVTLEGQVRWWRRNGQVFDTGIQFHAPPAALSEALANIRAREISSAF